jgi:hypothetical protein
MKREDIKNIIIFIGLIIAIVTLIIFNISKNNRIKNVDRKVNLVFGKFTYSSVFRRCEELFKNANKIVRYDYNYELDDRDDFKYYSVNNCNHCKRILNSNIIESTLSSSEVNKYIKDNNIAKEKDFYYIEKTNTIDSNYIGSIIDIESYDKKYVYLNSTNYYCDNYEYIGLLKEKPKCDYQTKESKITIVLEKNNIRINNLEEIKKIY